MSLLKVVEKDEANGRVAEIYESMMKAMGFVPGGFAVFSPSEHALDVQYSNLLYYIRHKTLGGKLLALIRLLVSEREECAYCVNMNTGILFQYGILPDMVAEIRKDPRKAPLDEKELTLLLFVLRMIDDSNSIKAEDIEKLHNLGWSDADILDASYHAASQVGVDKIFNAFKIEVEG
jgi:uncharacterized peroxidase-related enzyme